MLQSLFKSEAKTITGAAVILSVATLVSRLVGLLRDRAFATLFGASGVMDAYHAAFKVPDLIYNLLIVGALSAGFIPTFTRLFFENTDKKDAWRLVNNLLNILGGVLIALAILGAVAAPLIARSIMIGGAPETLALTTTFTRIMFISPFLLGISMIMGGVLQSLRHFTLYAMAPVVYNLGIIFGATVLTRFLGVSGIAWGVVVGAAAHCALLVAGGWWAGFRWQAIWQPKNEHFLTVLKLMLPRTAGLAATQLTLIAMTMLASFLPIGSIAVYNYANNLQAVPTGLIGIPFALAVFPVLARAAAAKEHTEFTQTLMRTTRYVLFLILPATVLVLLLRAQIVRIILGDGAFSWGATIDTANALAAFALGLWAQSLIPLFARAFYALNNTVVPLVSGLIAEVMGIAVGFVAMRSWGVSGLALGAAATAVVNALLLLFLLGRRLSITGNGLIKNLIKMGVATVGCAIAMQGGKYVLAELVDMRTFLGIATQAAGATLLGLGSYLVITWLVKSEEFFELKEGILRRWRRVHEVPVAVDENERLST